jgi:hypothetical protein
MLRESLKFALAVITLLFCGQMALGQAAAPSITLRAPATRASQTVQTSIDLQGSASSQSEIKNVVWVNQSGHRGKGSWTADSKSTSWQISGIPLQAGTNQITVTVVDANGRTASLHVAVMRKVSGTQPSLEVRSSTWNGKPVTYQVRNTMAVVEGDMILGPVAMMGNDSAGPSRAESAPVLQSAAPQPSAPGTVHTDGLGISYTQNGLWPQVSGVYIIPYITTGSSANLTSALTYFNQQFAGFIQFQLRNGQANYVNIAVEGDGSEGFSNVGMIGGEQSMTCGEACDVTTWVHEMGHTLGLLHEHQRPDRASYITLNLANADLPNVPGNFTLPTSNYQQIGLYDLASIMEYGAFDFSKAGLPVIETIPAGMPLSNNTGYSAGDIDAIERLYGAIPSQVTVTTNPSGLPVIVDGTTYSTTPQAFSWAIGTQHTLAVAPDPQTTNPSDGSTYMFGAWNDLGASSHMITVTAGSGSLTAPASAPAVTMYEANYIRLQPFGFLSPASFPTGSGSVSVTPTPASEFGGTFFPDRTLVTLTLVPAQGSPYNFYDWFNLPFPPSDNPHQFYIQSPLTQAQAVYVTEPVTIVGETLTGPNTWNPLLSGTVDSNFEYLPTGFSDTYDGTAWNPGTSHTVAVDQTQSPVTTNVYYNWNSWSDTGAISHGITQPATGTQSITASFTPYYASYTVPPALGANGAACYGGVNITPVGTAYPENNTFDFYGDGASVTTTATANSAFPAMLFAGWTGSLTGNTNPQTVTLHDQFVPTALFNTVATPLTITSISPATIPATSAAMDVTINGTGFSASTSAVNWNGSRRASTVVSGTQITLHLVAGDLATPGGQDIFVGNFTTNSSNATCSVGAEASLIVNPAAAVTLQAIAVTPASPSIAKGATQQFAATGMYSDGSTENLTSTATWSSSATTVATINSSGVASGVGAGSTTIKATQGAVSGSATLTVTLPPITLSPTSIVFGNHAVGTTATVSVTLANNSTAAIAISSIAITPKGTVSYTEMNSCGTSIAASATCAIQVTFDPQSTGAKNDFVTVTDSAGTQTVTLTGTGVASSIALSPSSIAYGNQAVGVSTTTPVTLKNNSAAAIAISSIAITPKGTVSYTETTDCGTSIAASATCTIQVTFDPQSTGAKDDFVTVTDAAGTQTVTLTGTGVASSITLTPASIAYGNQTVGLKTTTPVTLKNTSTAAIAISSIAITPKGTVSYTEMNNCGTSIAASATCTIQVTFDPQSTGAKNDFVTVTDAAGMQTVTLTGTGVASSITVSPASIAFGNQTVGVKSAPAAITVTNTSASAVTSLTVAMGGTNTVSFAQTNNCPTTLPGGGTCTIEVTFDPTGASAKSATVTLNDSAGTQSDPVTGTGVN